MVVNEKLSLRSYTGNKWAVKLTSYFILTAGALLMVMPFVWSVVTSFKQPAGVFTTPPFEINLPLDFGAYSEMLSRINYFQYAFNTFLVAGLITLGQLFTCSLSGYAFAKIKFPGREAIFLIFLSTLMVPAAVTMIPNFVVMRSLHLLDTLTALVLPFLGSAYGTFLMRQYYLTFPDELTDAAKLDGCNPFSFYYRILLPNSKPILATLALLTFQAFWNDFQWPLIVINSESKRTLQVGLSYLRNEHYINWPLLMAASVLTTLPIIGLFFLAQKQLVESVKLSGIK
jgi:multiple sugar transport system permease protein